MNEKIDVEVVRNNDGKYYVNMFRNGERVAGLPENVDYRTLKKSISDRTGFVIISLMYLKFKSLNGKQYAKFNNYETIKY